MSIESSFDVPRHWRLKKERYSLVGEICNHCKTKIFPPRDICPNCNEEAKELYQFSGKGEVYSYTKVFEPVTGFENQTPFYVAMIRLDEGPLVTAQLTDLDGDNVSIGMPVEMVTRKLRSVNEKQMLVYGYKFRPSVTEEGKTL